MSLFGFLGKVVGAGLNVATGGLSGTILNAGAAILGGQKARTTVSTALQVPISASPPIFRLPDSTVTRGVTLGGPRGVNVGSTTTYYGGPGNNGRFKACTTKDGKPRKTRKDGKCYKRPSMNAANPRALRRAIRRVASFQHLARECGFSRPPAAMKGVHHTPKKRGPRKCR
jgi:hypothetical protein